MLTRVLWWTGGLLLALLYLYAVVTGIGNFVGFVGLSGALDTDLSAQGRVWLIVGIAFPLVVFVLALLIGRRRSAAVRILLLAAGLALVAAWQIDIMHVIPESSYFA